VDNNRRWLTDMNVDVYLGPNRDSYPKKRKHQAQHRSVLGHHEFPPWCLNEATHLSFGQSRCHPWSIEKQELTVSKNYQQQSSM
jgi:hypothetical protein